eukprot:5324118-Ditylum_brightwellii.AAC.1
MVSGPKAQPQSLTRALPAWMQRHIATGNSKSPGGDGKREEVKVPCTMPGAQEALLPNGILSRWHAWRGGHCSNEMHGVPPSHKNGQRVLLNVRLCEVKDGISNCAHQHIAPE